MFARGRSEAKTGEGRKGKTGQRMKKIRIERPSGKDLIFEGEQIARITNPGGGAMALWKTRGGKYVLERTVENDKRIEIYNSAKEASSLIIDTYRSAGKKLIRAAQSKDRAFEGLTEERIE
jgi:hypothetical protein